ncbi:DUF2808 domain-containing protein [Oscillatoria salina]|uniref:DUF2808 domain-containing protein n=1 Tax=Oscillatoria salina TaxID=331517 RepID=UPI0013BA4CE8|nr:DUF2808 domain-containing protein [Oscillatoria salina]MBZ8180663.1 DUF2808 domain-containing protein [Oscillatoria salina IIICB1]NET89692.1 DUF2808 domain-containing protein [Kamptonema sp. SIO1D9]
MFSTKTPLPRFLSTLIATGCLVTGASSIALAQSNPGLTIFSGVENRSDILNYYLDFGGRPNGWDRYRLRIPAKKLELGVAQFTINYPDYYDGKFDTDDIEVRVKGDPVPLSEIVWDKDNHRIHLYLDEPIEARTQVELVFSNVKNPPFGGTYYFHALAQAPGDIPLPRYLGTWILSIGRN